MYFYSFFLLFCFDEIKARKSISQIEKNGVIVSLIASRIDLEEKQYSEISIVYNCIFIMDLFSS